MRTFWLGMTAAGALALALPGSAFGAVTIGSNLEAMASTAADFSITTNATVSQRTLIATHREPAGLTAPSNGVIVRFAVRQHEGPSAPVALRVIRPGGNALTATGAGTSAVAHPAGGVVTSFGLRPGMPIKAGDGIGLDGTAGSLQAYWFVAPGVGELNNWIDPALGDGDPPRTPAIATGVELLLQATIEPDVDGDRLGDETQDPDGGKPAAPPAGPTRCTLVNLSILHVRIGNLVCL
jgi:hypothetical protein